MTQQLVRQFAAMHNPENRWADLKPGMTVRVHQKLRQGEKGKATVFEGIIIAHKHGNEPGSSITVRHAAGGYGVEKVYPLRLPSIENIEIVKTGKARRAKLYYLRGKSAREIRRKTRAEQVALKALVTAPMEETPAAEQPAAE
jgi:large subunit ribosomal protein L19